MKIKRLFCEKIKFPALTFFFSGSSYRNAEIKDKVNGVKTGKEIMTEDDKPNLLLKIKAPIAR